MCAVHGARRTRGRQPACSETERRRADAVPARVDRRPHRFAKSAGLARTRRRSTATSSASSRRCVEGAARLPGRREVGRGRRERRAVWRRRVAEAVVLLRQVARGPWSLLCSFVVRARPQRSQATEFEGAAPDRPRGRRILHRRCMRSGRPRSRSRTDTVHGRRLAERRTHALALAATADRERVVAKGGAHAHAELAQDAVGEGRVGDGSEQWRRHLELRGELAAGPARPARAAAAAAGSWRGACGCAVSPSPPRDRPTPGSRTRSSAATQSRPAGAPP